ncbi:1-hydroxycarotenoid 3,4-desaturase CrtD [Sediminibacterium soli]|uniref:1-hydroxycarotenoid 3,4-desaturase CrtD n=1 Tax=Sediminibacterium soli TaxID=2698829 RepID=UPI00137A261D|nr:1-hydroxycarotenoid 3,4-desaturase CrtD [Sediminibacterium soli]NCI45398.1 phytoene desaturase [Sediminibacterium soli]
MSHSPRAVIIGAGIAGIASAIRLVMQGMAVTVFEKNDHPGGKIHAFERNGYHFDAGPSLFTMPENIEELFALAGEPIQDYFRYEKLPVTCRYVYEDGSVINAYADKERLAAEIAEKTGESPQALASYLEASASIFQHIGDIFINHSLHKRSTLLKAPVAKALLKTKWSYLFHSLDRYNRHAFRHPALVQLFNRFATYNGSDPYRAPGMLGLIPHLEFNSGVYYPRGGMVSIATALHQLALRKGVQFHFGTPVQRIICHERKARGVVVNNENIMCDLVVSNLDVYFTYGRLLNDGLMAQKLLRQERSSSALIFYWGINRSFPELQLHNIFFSGDYAKEFRHIFGLQQPYADPTVYVNITAKQEPGVQAPGGRENWFVMVNAPANRGQNWPVFRQQYRASVIGKLNRLLGVSLEQYIETEEILDPVQIEEQTGSFMGSLYGTSSNSRLSAFLRHPNFSERIRGLYFVGGSVHPGGGIPLCLKSAKIMSDIVHHDMRKADRH